eukprot:m.419595 g.419595  ORF g.419595 m.419595 type:complete len:714 (+) comp56627_c0_seq57:71-2212(+)
MGSEAVEGLCSAVQEGRVAAVVRLVRTYSPALITRRLDWHTTALHQAAEDNNAEILAFFLSVGPLVLEVRDDNDWTPLMGAVLYHSFKCYEMLATAGANIFATVPDVKTAFRVAVAAGDVAKLQQLESTAGLLDDDDELSAEAVRIAARLGRTDMLGHLLRLPKVLQRFKERKHDRVLALQRAVEGGQEECFQLLVDAGASIAACEELDQSLLHLAASNDRVAMLRKLLSMPAVRCNLDLQDDDGNAPVTCAVKAGSIGCFELLLDAGVDLSQISAGRTVLHIAAGEGQTDMVAYLLGLPRFRSQIDAQDEGGDTPVMTAVYKGKIDCLKHFVKAGCDLTIKNSSQETLLHAASRGGESEMVEHLLGIPSILQTINAVDDCGSTVLMNTIANCSIDYVRSLVRAGADVDVRDKEGQTALHQAGVSGTVELLRVLLEASAASINVQDNSGQTALMRSAVGIDSKPLALLLSYGADATLRDAKGQTALHVAAQDGNLAMLQLLLQASTADINTQDRDGNTPMMCACSVRSIEFQSIRDELQCDVIPEYLQAGADIHLRNKAGLTAKELARENMPKVAQLLQEHEEYLAQLGSSTKAALRTPVDAAPLELVDEASQGVVLLFGPSSADDHPAATDADAEAEAEWQPVWTASKEEALSAEAEPAGGSVRACDMPALDIDLSEELGAELQLLAEQSSSRGEGAAADPAQADSSKPPAE